MWFKSILVGILIGSSVVCGSGWQVLDFEQDFPQSKVEQLIRNLSHIRVGLEHVDSVNSIAVQQLIIQRLHDIINIVGQLQLEWVWPDDLSYLGRLLKSLQERFEQFLTDLTPSAALAIELFKKAQLDLITLTKRD